jgi:uncharacterized integral membrane protein
MIYVKYFVKLIKEFFGFAWKNKAWWIIPIIIILLLLAVLIFTGQVTAPFIYTLF